MAIPRWLSAVVFGALGSLTLAAPARATPHPLLLDHGQLPIATVRPTPFAPGDKLQYLGGEVISAVNIVAVSWGSSVDASYMKGLEGFYAAIVTSPWIDWMTEYDTIGLTGFVDGLPGSHQHIGRGTYQGAYVIAPANTSTALFDSDIATELIVQIKNGALPKPQINVAGQANTLYMVDFPPGISMTIGSSMTSCSSFGAYHSTLVYGGRAAGYGVHPYCGYGFDSETVVHSHELAEAMTDMEVGIATGSSSGRPAAWVDTMNGQEAGDLCVGSNATVAGYAVQQIWSNFAKGCVAGIPICTGSETPPSCRPCNVFDDGVSCAGATPACARGGASVGQCVACTAFYEAACEGTKTPVCNDVANACVGCLTSVDCGARAPVCETATNTCRVCAVNGECAIGSVCDTSSDAMKGECVECTGDADCTSGRICSPSRTCLEPPTPDAGLMDAGEDAAPADAPPADATQSGCGCSTLPTSSDAWGALLALLTVGFASRRRRASSVARD